MTVRVDSAEILAHHTGGGDVWTRQVNQRIGAQVTLVALRRGWRPAAVTLAAVTTSVTASALTVVALVVAGPGWAAGVAAVGWQLAYGLDCSDGQLARVSGRTSVAGGSLDLYGDWAARVALVAALVVAIDRGGWDVAPVVAVAVMAGQLVALFHEAVSHSGAVEDLPRTWVHEVLGVLRDPGALFFASAVAVALGPGWVFGVLVYGALLGAGQYGVRALRLVARAWQA